MQFIARQGKADVTEIKRVSRRDFLTVTGVAGSGLILGFAVPVRVGLAANAAGEAKHVLAPDVFLQLTADGIATVWVSRSEMGQGVRTSLPMIVAEELEIPWECVRVRQAPGANDGRYGSQLTGGSLSIRTLYDRLRRTGAVARLMLVTAAAGTWGTDIQSCTAGAGAVANAVSGQKIAYGDLVYAASELPVPDAGSVKLKDPADFQLIGKSINRVDQQDYIHGLARFGVDVQVQGMRYAAVERCPYYQGKLVGYDDSRAKKIPGVRTVVVYEGRNDGFYISPGVAVIADDTWSALQGVKALSVEWDRGEHAKASTKALHERFAELATQSGETLRNDGDASGLLSGATGVVKAEYEIPFLAHATMEPMNCVIDVTNNACEIWSPTQNPQTVQRTVAGYLGLPEDQVKVNVTLLGGGFGRRLYPDIELEAAGIARQVEGPVKVFWTREDDIRHDRYRPSSLHVLSGAIGSDGLPSAWLWRILNTHTDRFDADDFPAYAIPNYHVEYTHVPFVLPRGAWRATVNSYNPFVVQAFLDELAAAAGRDPLEFRLKMLRHSTRARVSEVPYDNERMIHVLETAAENAGWGKDLPDGVGRGIAFHQGYGSYIAEVAEVQVVNGKPRVRRVVCVVDCGQVINRDLVEAQCEGAIIFALSAVLKQEITVADGRVEQRNFSDFPMLQIDETPAIEIHIIESRQAPGGMGEVPLPPLAPAVANAIFDAVGTRIRRLPITAV